MVRERIEGEGLLNDSVAIVHFGGLGDVVLLSEVVARFRASEPGVRIVLYCREAYIPAVAQFAVPVDRVMGVPIDPYAANPPTETALAAARAFFEGPGSASLALFVAPELVPTWLTRVAIDVLQPARVRMLESDPVPGVHYDPLDEELRTDAMRLMAAVSPPSDPPLDADVDVRPRLTLHDGELKAARDARRATGRPPGYLAVFPVAEARVPWKIWPMASYAQLLRSIAARDGLGLLLVGGHEERPHLAALRDELRDVEDVEIVAGTSAELPATLARIALARAYVGNDTGLSHAASALGVPGVTIFGGGYWPAYRPWARGSVGVVAPLPCFGCGWNCAFDRGFCVESIGVDAVEAALRDALAEPGAPPRVMRVEHVTSLERDVIAHAAHHLRMVEARDRKAIRERDERIELMERAASERLEALNAVAKVGETVDELGHAAAERLADVQLLTLEVARLTREREEVGRAASLYENVANERLAALERVSEELDRSRARAERLEAEAEERLGLLFEAQSAAKNAGEAFAYEVAAARSEAQQARDLAASYEAVAAERLAALESTSAEAETAAEAYRAERETMLGSLRERDESAVRAAQLGAENEALRQRAEAAEKAARERLEALERTNAEAALAAASYARDRDAYDAAARESDASIAALSAEIEASRARADAADAAAHERLDVLERVNAEAAAAEARHREEREALAQALSEIEGESALGHDVVTAELESLRTRAHVAEQAAHERLESLERTAEQARLALVTFEEERAELLVGAIDRREDAVDLAVVAAELEALRARTLAAEEAARERLEALLESSEEMRRVSEEAERRSVLIAELTALVASQHEQLDSYSRRAGAKR